MEGDKIIMVVSSVLLAAILCSLVIILSAGTTKVNCSFNLENNNLYVQYDNDLEPLYHVKVTIQWYNGTVGLYDTGTSSGGNETTSFVIMPFNVSQYSTETGLEFNITAVSAQTTP